MRLVVLGGVSCKSWRSDVGSYSLIELLLRIVILLSLVVFAISHCENLCESVLVLALLVAVGDSYFM